MVEKSKNRERVAAMIDGIPDLNVSNFILEAGRRARDHYGDKTSLDNVDFSENILDIAKKAILESPDLKHIPDSEIETALLSIGSTGDVSKDSPYYTTINKLLAETAFLFADKTTKDRGSADPGGSY